MVSLSGLPWWGQVIVLIVVAIIAVYLFQNIILPLLDKVA